MVLPRHRIDVKYAAELGKQIYEERYRRSFEPQQNGKYLAIDLESGIAGLGDTSVDAMDAGKKAVPGGFFYLVHIGYPTTFVFH